jgi:hypothetical protein
MLFVSGKVKQTGRLEQHDKELMFINERGLLYWLDAGPVCDRDHR